MNKTEEFKKINQLEANGDVQLFDLKNDMGRWGMSFTAVTSAG